jgi:hypothetical protein
MNYIEIGLGGFHPINPARFVARPNMVFNRRRQLNTRFSDSFAVLGHLTPFFCCSPFLMICPGKG